MLRDAHGEEWWWEGVPSDVRKKYGERVQETRLETRLEEERKLPELYFIDFYFMIMERLSRLKEWKRRLDDLEPIRNAIMHCRGQYLAEERISRLKESCFELQKLVQKVKSNR